MAAVDPETGCNVGCPCKNHPGVNLKAERPHVDKFAEVTHRLVCDTCGCETSVATGEMDPAVVEMFTGFHCPPHHHVRDEHLLDGHPTETEHP